MTRAGVMACLTLVDAVHDKGVTRERVDAWLLLLADISDEQGENATVAALRASQWPPKPNEILERVHGTAQGRAEQQWALALKATKDVGAYRSPSFDDSLTSRVIASMGGWPAFCASEQEEHWLRREFVEIYQRLGEASGGQLEPVRLPGLHEGSSRGGGDLVQLNPKPPGRAA